MEASRMLLPRVLHHVVALGEHFLRAVEVHIRWRQERESAVMMLVVVPAHEAGDEGARRFG